MVAYHLCQYGANPPFLHPHRNLCFPQSYIHTRLEVLQDYFFIIVSLPSNTQVSGWVNEWMDGWIPKSCSPGTWLSSLGGAATVSSHGKLRALEAWGPQILSEFIVAAPVILVETEYSLTSCGRLPQLCPLPPRRAGAPPNLAQCPAQQRRCSWICIERMYESVTLALPSLSNNPLKN